MKVIITSPILPFCLCLLFEAEAAAIDCSCQSVYSIFTVLRIYNFATNCNKYDNCAIENCRSRKNKIAKASHFKVHWVEYLVSTEYEVKKFCKSYQAYPYICSLPSSFSIISKDLWARKNPLTFFMN